MRDAGTAAIQTSLHPQIGPDAVGSVTHTNVDAEAVDRALGAFRDNTSGG